MCLGLWVFNPFCFSIKMGQSCCSEVFKSRNCLFARQHKRPEDGVIYNFEILVKLMGPVEAIKVFLVWFLIKEFFASGLKNHLKVNFFKRKKCLALNSSLILIFLRPGVKHQVFSGSRYLPARVQTRLMSWRHNLVSATTLFVLH